LAGNDDYPDFLSHLSFYTPIFNTRSANTFHLSLHVTNYANKTPCNRIMQSNNKLKIDMFNSPNLYSLKLYCSSWSSKCFGWNFDLGWSILSYKYENACVSNSTHRRYSLSVINLMLKLKLIFYYFNIFYHFHFINIVQLII
jgi:hypothetical protein